MSQKFTKVCKCYISGSRRDGKFREITTLALKNNQNVPKLSPNTVLVWKSRESNIAGKKKKGQNQIKDGEEAQNQTNN